MKYARLLVLAAAMIGLTVGAMTAQDTKKAAPQAKKGDDEKKVKGKVEYYEAGDGWRWKVTVGEKALAMSTRGVKKKEDALKDIEDVKAILAAEKPTEGKATDKAKGKDKDKE